MHRLSSSLIIVLTLAVFAVAGYVIIKKDPVPNAGTVPASAFGATSTASTTPAGDGSSSSGGPRVVAFLGDDWTAGIGASSTSKRFSTLVAASLGVTERNFGVDGSGYAKAGSTGGAYDERVDAVVADKPDVVVVAGGRNDTNDYLPTLQSRIKALFAQLHARLPKATIIAVAPMWGDSDAPAELEPVSAAVQQYVTASDGTYLDLADPIHDHPEYMATDADPNDKGYAAIAAALTPRIKALLN